MTPRSRARSRRSCATAERPGCIAQTLMRRSDRRQGGALLAAAVGEIAYAVAAAILASFAVWLLYLSPRQRATRALAALLLAMAAAWSFGLVLALAPLRQSEVVPRVMPSTSAVIGLATIYFLCVYPRPRGWIGRSPWSGWAAAALGLAAVGAFFLVPSLWGVPFDVEGEWRTKETGPLFLVNNVWSVTAAALLLALAIEHTRTPAGPLRRALTLVLGGFMGSALAWQSSLVFNDLGYRMSAPALTPVGLRIGFLIEEVSLVLVLGAPLLLLVAALRSKEAARRREGFGVALLALVVIALALVVGALSPPPPEREWISGPQQILDAAGGVLIAALAGYALLKHRLFDIDVKLRWTIRRGTVAALFVGIFFVASQMAQNFLEDSMGWALGGVIAGLMLFAIAPIQRVADHVADVAMPMRVAGVREKQLETYRLALALALADRVLTRDEERHLAHLAEHLGLAHTDTFAIREQMERELGIVPS